MKRSGSHNELEELLHDSFGRGDTSVQLIAALFAGAVASKNIQMQAVLCRLIWSEVQKATSGDWSWFHALGDAAKAQKNHPAGYRPVKALLRIRKLKHQPVSGSKVIQGVEKSTNIKEADKPSPRTVWRWIAEIGNGPALKPGKPKKTKM